ncbi:MAG: hypothetical protein NTU83_13070, partial [Candidatus Hydrogenedentes bacterium]|nr:hypothetical protein [Candidatus Hydrogenedentota bacterium]
MSRLILVFFALAILSLAGSADADKKARKKEPPPPSALSDQTKPAPVSPDTKRGETGRIEINVTDVLGNDIPARVELQSPALPKPLRIE